MTTVKCNLKFCTNNIDETCQLRHIDLTLGWGIYDYDNCGCSCFDDITEHEDYQEEYYKLIRPKGTDSEVLFKEKARGKRIKFEEFVLYTGDDYRNLKSGLTEEKSGLFVGTIGALQNKEYSIRLRNELAEHFRNHKPVSEYEETFLVGS